MSTQVNDLGQHVLSQASGVLLRIEWASATPSPPKWPTVESRVSQRDEHHHLDPMHRHVSLSACEFPAAFETRQYHWDKACSTRSGVSLRYKPHRALVQSFVSDADRLASLHLSDRACAPCGRLEECRIRGIIRVHTFASGYVSSHLIICKHTA